MLCHAVTAIMGKSAAEMLEEALFKQGAGESLLIKGL